ncbi:MAG TPA: DUF4382 domain-containing protein [Terriglobales bacterium]|nr:DUF4382 domain-containing protein [Terriglobales bacterium]
MDGKFLRFASGMVSAACLMVLIACGGGSGSNNSTSGTSTSTSSSTQSGTVSMLVSDDPAEDWAAVDVKILSIALTPQGGGTPVTVYTAPTPAPSVNLVELDQLGEILGNVQVPAGTYTSAVVTLSGNPGDVSLVVGANPESGFPGTPGSTIPSSQIQIQGTSGSTGSKTVQATVNFESPLVVTAGQNNALDLEFNLAHPAFLVDHVPASGTPFWAINFNGPLRHHPLLDITSLVLRHMYGTVTAVSTDNSNVTITRDFPVRPPTNPETAITSNMSLQILADSTNGTIFYDMDAKTHNVIKDFSSVASTLTGKYVRIAARYQQNGTLVAVRMWASSSFNTVWISPEGHVLHVDTTADTITVQNEDGTGVPVAIDANTQFFYRAPQNALADSTPIGTGVSFLTSGNLVRGFKVHVSVVDPLAVPMVAQTVDIEIARYDGVISLPTTTNFTYTHDFFRTSDDYTQTLPYISNTTPNGKDANGNAITGFKWWNFAFPTILDSGANAIPDFVLATNGSVNFGGTVSPLKVSGETWATWGDPANQNGWSAPWVVLEPASIPIGVVATPWVSGSTGGSFGLSVPGGTNTVNVTLSTVSGSATLVYQVDRSNGILTITPQDITSATGLANVTKALVNGTLVKAFGIPQADGTIKGYVLFYYTGNLMPME